MVIAFLGASAVRAIRPAAPSRLSERLESLVLVVVLITGAGGLALLLSGPGPKETLHLLYGALAFGILPVARSLSRSAGARRQAVITCIAAAVVLVVIARLYGTG